MLAGLMAVTQGFTLLQSIGLLVFVFAGAAQLISISMVAAGRGFIAIFLTTLVITAEHLMYALILREPSLPCANDLRLKSAFTITRCFDKHNCGMSPNQTEYQVQAP